MKKWEYRVERDVEVLKMVEAGTLKPVEDIAIDKSIDLAAFGKEGWELVAIREHSWYFKREL